MKMAEDATAPHLETGGAARVHRAEPIAVVGLGCRFPGGADSPDAYWRLLSTGQSAIREVPADRFSTEAFYSPNPDTLGTSTTKWGGFLDDVRGFDPAYFDISPREAQSMDPQQRLLLEVVAEALADGGLTQAGLRAAVTGVFVGVSTSDYGVIQRYRRTLTDVYAGPGGALSIVANRISHRLNLTGPSSSVDTACSSSLVAVDQAAVSLQTGRCDIAIAGGVNVLADPGTFVMFSKAGMMSTTGMISTFDKRANGYVRGEGAGVVVLKRLADAERDGDTIHAVLRATCVNQDGHTSTLTAPNGAAQAAMLAEVCARAGIAPEAVDYVEAHGTGTPVGDPIEAHAIGSVFGRPGAPVAVGSVKPVIGHLEAAAGISGLIKTVLCVEKGQIPPNANFSEPNPNIPFDALGIAVPRALQDITGGRPALAVVNSFGFGGTNASAVVEAYQRKRPAAAPTPEALPGHVMLPLSGASEASLAANAGALAEAIEAGSLAGVALAEIGQALATQRDARAQRAGVVAASVPEAVQRLHLLAAGEVPPPVRGQLPAIVTGTARKRGKVAFTFAGQGGQWWGMARSLLTAPGPFRTAFDSYDAVFSDLFGWSVRGELMKDEASSRVNESVIAQPAIFGVQMALAAWWRAQGVVPDLVLGHSFGEAAASYVSGALDLESATRLIGLRAQTHAHVSRPGGMMAVGLPADRVLALTAGTGLEIAARNGPATCTATGPAGALDAAEAILAAAHPDVLLRRLVTDTAWHSSLLDEVDTWFHQTLGQIAHQPPHTPFVSTVTAKPEVALDLDYWWGNMRQPVNYQGAVEMALDLGADTFIELSPHRVLTGLTSGIAAHRGIDVVLTNSLVRGEPDAQALGVARAQLFCGGAVERPAPPAPPRARLALPPYQWDRQSYWAVSEEAQAALFEAKVHPLLGFRLRGPGFDWSNEFSLASDRYLTGHAVETEVVFPAAGYLDMMLAATRDALGEGTVELTDVEILAAMFIRNDDEVLLHTQLTAETGRVEIRSRVRGGSEAWVLRATARARLTDAPLVTAVTAPDPVETEFDRAAFYARTELHGLVYRGAFQCVRQQRIGARRGSAEIEAPEAIAAEVARHAAHPALLDGLLQTVVGAETSADGATPLYLPVRIGQLRALGPLPARFTALSELKPGSRARTLGADYAALDATGALLLTVDGLEMRELDSRRAEATSDEIPTRHVVESFVEALLPARDETAFAGADWLVVGGGDAAPELIARLVSLGARAEALPVAALASGDETALAPHLARWRASPGARLGVVFAAALALLGPAADGPAVAARVGALTNAQLALGRAFKALEATALQPRLAVLSRAARAVAGVAPGGVTEAVAASQIGLARTLANECPANRVIAIDLDSEGGLDTALHLIGADTAETEWVLRGRIPHVPRLRALAPEALPRRPVALDLTDPGANVEVTMAQPGAISALTLRRCATPEPGPGQVLVRTRAVGLNFRDVMAVTGLLPAEAEPEPAWLNLGLEYAGEVEAVGPGVTDLAAGDRVMAIGSHCLQARQLAEARGLIRLPEALDFAGSATIPSVFSTAWHALVHVARLAPGERVLIHLATGGVGLAAIQIAQAIGAEIYATAGSEEKRAHLRGLGLSHVYGSRSLAFADEIARDTGGEGVDVVLNALPGPYIDKGLRLLRPFGRFVEIGKRDVYADTPLGLRALRENISVHVVDLAAMGRDRPAMLAGLMQEVMAEFAAGRLAPIPHTSFAVSRVQEAFQTMSRARHIGKIVVTFEADTLSVPGSAEAGFAADPQGVYLVTGGSRGFGIAVAEWLSRAGAGEVALASRSGEADAAQAPRLDEIAARGTHISQHKLDITRADDVHATLAALTASGRRLAGIIHGAAVIKDGFLAQQSPELVADAVGPKVAGAMNLLGALSSLGLDPDFVVSFSSVAQMVGSIGQANYVAANAFLDGFAELLRARGVNGLTLDWGALGDSGFVARSDAMGRYLKSMGMEPVTDAEAVGGLEQALASDLASVAFARVDWAAIGRMLASGGLPPRLSEVVAARATGAHQIRADLAEVPQEDWPALVGAFLIGEVSTVLGLDAEAVSETSGLVELGFDSLSSIELKNRLESQIGITISVGDFLTAATLGDVTGLLVDALLDEARNAEARPGDGDETGTDSAEAAEAFRAAARQVQALAAALAPMTTPEGRLALEHAGQRALAPEVSAEAALAAWDRLTARQPLLKLALQDGALALAEAAPPATPTAALAPALAAPLDPAAGLFLRPLVGTGGTPGLGLRLHAALGDATTLARLLDDWAALAEGRPLPEAPARAALFAALRHASGTVDGDAATTDEAYWRALGAPPVPAVALPARRLALAPAGLGLNRGQTLTLAPSTALAPRDEADWLFAFAAALAEATGADDLVVARSRLAAAAPLPWAPTVPVWLRGLASAPARARAALARQLDRAPAHDAFELAAYVARQGKALRAAGSVPAQIGFEFDTRPDTGARVLPAPTAHDLCLRVRATETGQRVSLHIDLAALDESRGRALLSSLLQRLTGTAPGSETIAASALAPQAPAAPALARAAGLLPATPSAQAVMSALTAPTTTATFLGNWTINQALRVRPGLDAQRLAAAVESLVGRHDTLRLRHVFTPEGVRVRVEPRLPSAFGLRDLGNIDDDEMRAAVLAEAAAPIDLETGPLFGVTLFKGGAGGDVVLLHMTEFVGDGWSLALLIDELIRTYIGAGAPSGPGTRYEALLAACQPPADPAIAAHWREVLRPAVPMPAFGRAAKGLPLAHTGALAPFALRQVPIGAAGTAALTARASRLGVNQNALVGAALMQTLADWSGADTLYMGSVHPLRNSAALADKVGFVAGRLPVRADVAEAGSVDALARQLQHRFTENNRFAHPGLSFEAPEALPDGTQAAQADWSLFGFGRMLPETMYKNSMAASLLEASGGAGLTVGGLEIAGLPLAPYGLTRGDFNLRPQTAPEGIELNFFHDLLSLDEAEAARFLDDVLVHLALPDGATGAVTVSGPVGAPGDLAALRAGQTPPARPLRPRLG